MVSKLKNKKEVGGYYPRDVHRYLWYGGQLYGGRKGEAALMGQEAGCHIAAQLL
jgi:hypothetical protein